MKWTPPSDELRANPEDVTIGEGNETLFEPPFAFVISS